MAPVPLPSWSKLRKAVVRPYKIPFGIYRRVKKYFGAHALNQYYHRRLGLRDHNTDGIDIMSADWDNLILLDGCRFDLFEENNTLPGELRSVESRGSHTQEWVQANLLGRELRDTVYVTASPILAWRHHWHDGEADQPFHDVIDIWHDSWDDDLGTVHPEQTTRAALDALREYPNKRILVHYMQPHYPFIGSDISGYIGKTYQDRNNEGRNIWGEIERGEIDVSHEELWAAYEENLDLTLPYVETCLKAFTGKTVVTADHGNLFGERAFPVPTTYWGHPKKMYLPELVKVPWLEHERTPRKTITAERSMSAETGTTDGEISERLQDLGYAPG